MRKLWKKFFGLIKQKPEKVGENGKFFGFLEEKPEKTFLGAEEFLFFGEKDAGGGEVSVDEGEHLRGDIFAVEGGFRVFDGERILDNRADEIFTDQRRQDVVAGEEGFGAVGAEAEGNLFHAHHGRFFLDAAGVGDDEAGVLHQFQEVRVASEWVQEEDVFVVFKLVFLRLGEEFVHGLDKHS